MINEYNKFNGICMSIPPPALPDRRPKLIQYPEPVLHKASFAPTVTHAPITIIIAPKQLQSMTLTNDIVCYKTNGRTRRVDICTAQEIADGQSCASMCDEKEEEEEECMMISHQNGRVVANGVHHELSQVHSIATAIFVDHHYWISFGNNLLVVYEMVDEKLKLKLSWMADACGVRFSFCPLTHRIACLLSSGQLVIYDSLLIKYRLGTDMKLMKSHYSTEQEIRIQVSTWNVNSTAPPIGRTFWREWLGMTNDPPDLIVIGIQEMVDLESSDQLRCNSERICQWQTAIEENCGKTHVFIDTLSLVGLVLFIVKKNTSLLTLKHTSSSTIKTGLKGRHGNKGAVAWRAFIDDTSICFVNCHLAAGHLAVEDRNADASTILKLLKFFKVHLDNDKSCNYETIMEHDLVFFFGDLNYRIAMDRSEVVKLTKQHNYSQLLKHDQLQSINSNSVLYSLQEGSINFPPTYKYDPGTTLFDTSDKQRVPSYCDRILYKPSQALEQLSYSMYADICSSDHRPVHAMFSVRIHRHDRKRLLVFKHAHLSQLYDKLLK